MDLLYYKGKTVAIDGLVTFMDFEEKVSDDDSKTLEVIFRRKSLLSRLKVKAKRTVVELPNTIFSLIVKFFACLAGMIGFGSVGSASLTIAKSLVSTKKIAQFVMAILSMFFPFLGAFNSMAKLI